MNEKQSFVDFVYNLDKLNAVFALSSVALAISMIWMVWADYDREWKGVQRAAMALEQHKVETEISAAEAAIDKDRLASIESRMKEVENSLEAKADELNGVQDSLEILRGEHYIADQNLKFEKAEYDVVKYGYEEAAHNQHNEEAAEKRAVMDEMERRMAEFRLIFEAVDARREEQRTNLAEIEEAQTALQSEKNALFKDAGLLERRLSNLEPSFQNQFRNAPLVDFIDPTVKIRQIVLGDLKNDINFIRVPKVDRCNTCHVNIDRTGFEIDWETATFNDPVLADYMKANYEEDERIGMTKVMASHPNLDLFMSSASPHPMEGVGCTSCHVGRDRGVTFVNTAHTPSDAAEQTAQRTVTSSQLPVQPRPWWPRIQGSLSRTGRSNGFVTPKDFGLRPRCPRSSTCRTKALLRIGRETPPGSRRSRPTCSINPRRSTILRLPSVAMLYGVKNWSPKPAVVRATW